VLLIYTDGRSRPQVFTDVHTAKRTVEEALCVTADENPQWWESTDRWTLTMRWRSQLTVLWKAQIET